MIYNKDSSILFIFVENIASVIFTIKRSFIVFICHHKGKK